MNNTHLPPLFRRSLGFDRINDFFDSIMQSDNAHYPPYNIEKIGENDYRISVSAAGFSPEDLEINLDNQVLTVSGKVKNESSDKTAEYLYKGISNRSFQLSLRLDPHMEVEDADYEHGLLKIQLKRVVPEGQKSRQIPIGRKIEIDTSENHDEAPQGQ
ncbi:MULTISPECIES: Hsp20 family protein [unclassified Acinetobacter]|uniref:Hsp20 family protein n=1 Tax=unclassified Acinetobacter TaxID=196816 RepID=UPI002360E425|nr:MULTISPECIES: Hsp20 family protein [unclassified Acinetobacter]